MLIVESAVLLVRAAQILYNYINCMNEWASAVYPRRDATIWILLLNTVWILLFCVFSLSIYCAFRCCPQCVYSVGFSCFITNFTLCFCLQRLIWCRVTGDFRMNHFVCHVFADIVSYRGIRCHTTRFCRRRASLSCCVFRHFFVSIAHLYCCEWRTCINYQRRYSTEMYLSTSLSTIDVYTNYCAMLADISISLIITEPDVSQNFIFTICHRA